MFSGWFQHLPRDQGESEQSLAPGVLLSFLEIGVVFAFLQPLGSSPVTMTDLRSLRVASQFKVAAAGSSALERISHLAPQTYVWLVCLNAPRSDPLPPRVHFSCSNLFSGLSDLGFLKAALALNNRGKDMKCLTSRTTRSLISLSSGLTFFSAFLFLPVYL